MQGTDGVFLLACLGIVRHTVYIFLKVENDTHFHTLLTISNTKNIWSIATVVTSWYHQLIWELYAFR